jgi:hypothetical protein
MHSTTGTTGTTQAPATGAPATQAPAAPAAPAASKAPAATQARTRGSKAPAASKARKAPGAPANGRTPKVLAPTKVAPYRVYPLGYPASKAATAKKLAAQGASLAAVAKAIGVATTGQAAMALLVAHNALPAKAQAALHKAPGTLAVAVANGRHQGASWGLLAARYGVTEGTVRAAYQAATGRPHSTLDYRRRNGAPVAG